MKLLPLALIMPVFSLSGGSYSYCSEESDVCKPIFDRLEQLIKQYYPQAKFERKQGLFIAKFDTRTFMIHHALKTGEWQEACAQEGPNRKGIRCSIKANPGPWMGAAVLPQIFDNKYFSSLMIAPYNKKFNLHLAAHLDYTDSTSKEFVKTYQDTVNDFAR